MKDQKLRRLALAKGISVAMDSEQAIEKYKRGEIESELSA